MNNKAIIDLVSNNNDQKPEDDGINIDDAFDLTINPAVVRLEKLLELAEGHKRGAISVRGVLDDGETQWGVIAVAGPNSRTIMDALDRALVESTDTWPDEEPTRNDLPTN